MTASSKSIEPKQCSTCNRIFATESDFLSNTSRWRICDRKNLWLNCQCGSTLVILKGKFDWYSPEKTLSPAAAGLFNKIGSLKALPHIPMSIMEITEMLSKPEVDIPSVAKKVRHDPFLAANLLEIANNLKLSRDPSDRKKIDGIEHAIMYIGKKAFGELVMTISLQGFATATSVFNTERHWKESFVVAELAEHISLKWGNAAVRDEVFISAALCNIGKIVGSIALPENTDKIELMVNNPKTLCTWPQAEAILKVPGHSLLGEIGGAIWGLPSYVLDAISSHHRVVPPSKQPSTQMPKPKFGLNESVALANQLSHWILLRPSRIDDPLVKSLTSYAGITQSELEKFASDHLSLAKRAA